MRSIIPTAANARALVPPPSEGNVFALREFVYVLHRDRAAVQIGWTTSPSSRISHVQTGARGEVHYTYVAGVAGAAAVVEGARAILDAHKLGDGWFGVSPELGIAAVAVAAHRRGIPLKTHDPEDSERTIPRAPPDPAETARDAGRRRRAVLTAAAIASFIVVLVGAALVLRGAGGL